MITQVRAVHVIGYAWETRKKALCSPRRVVMASRSKICRSGSRRASVSASVASAGCLSAISTVIVRGTMVSAGSAGDANHAASGVSTSRAIARRKVASSRHREMGTSCRRVVGSTIWSRRGCSSIPILCRASIAAMNARPMASATTTIILKAMRPTAMKSSSRCAYPAT